MCHVHIKNDTKKRDKYKFKDRKLVGKIQKQTVQFCRQISRSRNMPGTGMLKLYLNFMTVLVDRNVF